MKLGSVYVSEALLSVHSNPPTPDDHVQRLHGQRNVRHAIGCRVKATTEIARVIVTTATGHPVFGRLHPDCLELLERKIGC
jgi:hypothetical protein